MFDGESASSVFQASQKVGVTPETVRRRIKSKKPQWKNWYSTEIVDNTVRKRTDSTKPKKTVDLLF